MYFNFSKLHDVALMATVIPIENVKRRLSTESKSLNRLKYKQAELLHGEPRDAACRCKF